jgi:Skp family chaperone for outer membrane proteins
MRRFAILLLLASAAAVGTATGYAVRAAAELVPGTYYIDLGRALPETPEFKNQLAALREPLNTRAQQLQALNAELENDRTQLAVMDPASVDARKLFLSLKIREETIHGEMDLLKQASRGLEEEYLLLASKRVHEAAEALAIEKGYEALVVSPIALDEMVWDNPKQTMELLRQRSTFWIHPDRDVTGDLIAILAR